MITKLTITQRVLMPKESEETEVKNMKWFKKKLDDIEVNTTSLQNHDAIWMLNRVHELYDQLDEPEVLSQEWIDDESMSVLDTFNRHRLAVPVEKLENLLVPKQEEITEEQAWEVLSEIYDIPNKSYIREAMRVVADSVGDESTLGELKEQLAKPVIPQFVANWIENNKDVVTIKNVEDAIKEIGYDQILRLVDWYENDNQDTFARAWLDGFTVEEDQKYIINTGNKSYLFQLSLNYVNNPPETTVTYSRELAIRFSDRELAHKVADLVNNGEVEELEE